MVAVADHFGENADRPVKAERRQARRSGLTPAAAAAARKRNRWTLPLAVLGSSSTKSTQRGYF